MPTVTMLIVAGVFARNPDASADILPLRRLRLYETGVGYFERRGPVSGGRTTALPVPSSHLDDALKTLVVLGNGRRVDIGGIEFASSVSEGMARAIAGLPLEAETELGWLDLLASLEGVDVEITAGKGRVRGRLVEVLGPFDQATPAPLDGEGAVAPAPAPAHPREPEYTLVVRTSAGALRRVRTSDLSAIRPTEAAANQRFDVALAALSSRSPQASRLLDVQIAGSGPLELGYIAETPVWRTTYRVVLDDQAKSATLQAWALVHNDTDEDWRSVELELVNGRPTSFLFPLAAPRYARRDLAAPEVELSTVPQLLNTTADRLWGDFVEGAGGLGLSGTGYGGGGSGEGTVGLGSIGTIGHGGGGGAGEPALGDLAQFAQATGEESGALFVYRLPAPIDLAAHHSALVPVVELRMEAEAITWFAPDETAALMGARLLNDTGQTLPAGTVAFFDPDGFQGESAFDRLKPGEQTFAVHGVDLDVDLERTKVRVGEEILGVSSAQGELVEQVVAESRVRVELRNRSGRPRTVYVGLPVERNATLEGHEALDFDHIRDVPLAKFALPARETLTHELTAREGETRSTPVGDLAAARLTKLARVRALTPAQRTILESAAALRTELDTIRSASGERVERIAHIETELERLREDLRALGSTGFQNRSTRTIGHKVVEHEEEIARLRRENEQAARDDAQLAARMGDTLAKL
jgi:hypothetical protein